MKRQESDFDYTSIINIGIWRKNIIKLDVNFLINTLYNLSKSTPSINRSNSGGYQSPPNLSTIPHFSNLIKIINDEVFKITNNTNTKILDMWGNISSFTNYNHIHTHNTDISKFSGILYLKTPPNSGNILFYNPLDLNCNREYTPQEKDLLIFPSILLHSVNPNLSQEDRISIAFNFS